MRRRVPIARRSKRGERSALAAGAALYHEGAGIGKSGFDRVLVGLDPFLCSRARTHSVLTVNEHGARIDLLSAEVLEELVKLLLRVG